MNYIKRNMIQTSVITIITEHYLKYSHDFEWDNVEDVYLNKMFNLIYHFDINF